MNHHSNIILIMREVGIAKAQRHYGIQGELRTEMNSYLGNLEEIFGEPLMALHIMRPGLLDDVLIPKVWLWHSLLILVKSVRGVELIKNKLGTPKEVTDGLHPLFELPLYQGKIAHTYPVNP